MQAEIYQAYKERYVIWAGLLWLIYNLLLDFFRVRLTLFGNLEQTKTLDMSAEAFPQFGMFSAYQLFYWALLFLIIFVVQPIQRGMVAQEVANGQAAYQVLVRRLRFIQVLIGGLLLIYIFIPYVYAGMTRGFGQPSQVWIFIQTVFFYELTHFLVCIGWLYLMLLVYLFLKEKDIFAVVAIFYIIANNVLYALKRQLDFLEMAKILWLPYWFQEIPKKQSLYWFLPMLGWILLLKAVLRLRLRLSQIP